MRSVRLASLLVGAGLFLAACGDNGTADSDGGTDGGADGGDARVPDATVDRQPDSATADAGLPQPKLVDSDNTTSAIRPRIAVNASGRALAIWLTGCTTTTDPSSTGTATLSMCTEVWGNAFISGNWGNATKLTSGVGGIRAGSSLEYPDVAIDSAGNGVAVWHQNDATPNQRVNAARWNGTAWSAAQLLDDGTSRARRVRVAAGNGTAVAVWEQGASPGGANANMRVFASRLVGTTWSPAARLENNNMSGIDADVGMDAQGNAIAVWSQSTRSDGGREMWSNRIDGTSGNLGTAVVVGTDPVGAGNTPSIAVSANGSAIFVWNEGATTVKANRWSGTAWGANGVAIENSPAVADAPVAAIDAAGNGYAAFQLEAMPVNAVVNTMSPSGVWGALQPVEQFTEDNNNVRVGAGNGNGVVVWSQLTSGDNNHIKGTFFNGSAVGPVLAIENQDGTATHCDVGMDAQGVAHVIWIQNIGLSNRTDVFSAVIQP